MIAEMWWWWLRNHRAKSVVEIRKSVGTDYFDPRELLFTRSGGVSSSEFPSAEEARVWPLDVYLIIRSRGIRRRERAALTRRSREGEGEREGRGSLEEKDPMPVAEGNKQ